MMNSRDFSDSIKLEIIKQNLQKNNGVILCETCGKQIFNINECHFDHIFPFAKGGKSELNNCQILCSSCNLKKNDKLLQDFVIEEKAKQFLSGGNISEVSVTENNSVPDVAKKEKMTKDEFDTIIHAFIEKKGNISKVDFGREYNNLPSIHYVRVFYGDLTAMKKSFGIVDMSYEWDRKTINGKVRIMV